MSQFGKGGSAGVLVFVGKGEEGAVQVLCVDTVERTGKSCDLPGSFSLDTELRGQ